MMSASAVQQVEIPLELAQRAAEFSGRTWVLDAILDWIDGDGRYLFCIGEPGSGKSALSAWLCGEGRLPTDTTAAAKLERIRNIWRGAHFCLAGDLTTVNPSGFAQNLAKNLSDRYDDYAVAVIDHLAPKTNIHQEARENWGRMVALEIGNLIVASSDPLDVYYRTIAAPLQELEKRRPDLKLFLLIDALDEANAVQLPNIVTLLAQSKGLPRGVRFLLTSRPEPRILDQFPGAPRIDLSSQERRDDADSDIREYVTLRTVADPAIGAAVAGTGPAAMESKLVSVAEGNFLYMKFLLDEAAHGRSLSDLNSLPKGLYALYREYLDRMMPQSLRPAPDNEARADAMLRLLATLSVAAAPVGAATLADWLGLRPEEVTRLLVELSQVVEREGDGYRLYHRSIAEFFDRTEYSEGAARTVNRYYRGAAEQHERIAQFYLSRYRDGWEACDSYGLRHLSSHLHRLASKETYRRELYGLIAKPVMEAKLARSGSHLVFAGDVAQALATAQGETPPNDIELVKATLVATELVWRAKAVPLDALSLMVRLGRIDEAIDRARLLPDSALRIEALLRVAETLAKGEAPESATDLLNRVRTEEGVDARTLTRTRQLQIEILVRLENFEEARHVAAELPQQYRRAALNRIVQGLIEAGRFDEARQCADSREVYRNINLEMIASIDRKSGFEAAIEATNRLSPQERQSVLVDWTQRLIKEDRINEAVAVGSELGGDSLDVALEARARRLIAAGNYDEARISAGEIAGEWRRNNNMDEIATAAAANGNFPAALGAADATSKYHKPKALAAILKSASDKDGVAAALSLADSLSKSDQAEALEEFALSLLEAGASALALNVVKHLSPPAGEKVLEQWAEKMARGGNYLEAWATAAGITVTWRRKQVCGHILEHAGRNRDFAAALELAASPAADFEAAEMLGHVLLSPGSVQSEVLDTVRKRFTGYSRSFAVSGFASRLSERSELNRALSLVGEIEDQGTRDRTRRELVNRCIATGNLDQALSVASVIESAAERSVARAIVARHLAQTGQTVLAAQTAQEAIATFPSAADADLGLTASSAAVQALWLAGHEAVARDVLAAAELSPGATEPARVEFIRALALTGRGGEALAVASGVEDDLEKAKAMAEATLALARSRHVAEMEAAIPCVLKVLPKNSYCRFEVLTTLLHSIVLVRRYDLAPMALGLMEGDERKRAISAVARMAPVDVAGTIELSKLLDSWPDRAVFLAEAAHTAASPVAEELAREVVTLAATAPDDWMRRNLLAKMAALFADAGAYNLLDSVMQAAGPDAKTIIFDHIANHFFKTGKDGIARELLNRLGDQQEVVRALATQAMALASQGSWRQGWAALKPILPSASAQPLASILRRAAEQSDLAAGVSEMQAVLGPKLYQDVLRSTASGLLQESEVELAVRLLPELDSGNEKDHLLSKIATFLAEAQRFDRALELAGAITQEYRRADEVAGVLQRMATVRGVPEALAAAGTIPDGKAKGKALSRLVQKLVEIDRHQAATVAQAIDPDQRESAVEVLARAGELAAAWKLAREMPDSWEEGKAREHVAVAAVRAGNLDLAFDVAAAGRDDWRNATIWNQITKEVARTGDFERATELADRIERSGPQAEALAGLGQLTLDAGLREKAAQFLQAALRVAEMGQDRAHQYDGPLHDLVAAIAKRNKPEIAAGIAAEISLDTWQRVNALRYLGWAWRRAKNDKNALAAASDAWGAAQTITDPNVRASQDGYTVNLLLALGERRRLDRLLQSAKSDAAPGAAALVFAVVALRIAEAATRKPEKRTHQTSTPLPKLERARTVFSNWTLRAYAARLAGAAVHDAAMLPDGSRARVLVWAAIAFRQAGRKRRAAALTVRALKLSEGIEEVDRIWNWSALALASGRAGDSSQTAELLGRALSEAETLVSPERALREQFLDTLCEVGSREQIERVLSLVARFNLPTQSGFLSAFVSRVWWLGKGDETAEIRRRLIDLVKNSDVSVRSTVIEQAVTAIVDPSDRDLPTTLLTGLRTVTVAQQKATVGGQIARALAQVGWRNLTTLAEELVRWTSKVDDPQAKFRALSAAAEALSVSGKSDRALDVFRQALVYARLLDPGSVVFAFGCVVPALATKGDEATLTSVCDVIVNVRRWWPPR